MAPPPGQIGLCLRWKIITSSHRRPHRSARARFAKPKVHHIALSSEEDRAAQTDRHSRLSPCQYLQVIVTPLSTMGYTSAESVFRQTNITHDRRSCADFTLEVEANVA